MFGVKRLIKKYKQQDSRTDMLEAAMQAFIKKVCEIIKFEINTSFLVKLFSYMTKKVRTKI